MSPKLKDDSTNDPAYIDTILCRHARKLLETNCLRDLGYFAANIDEIHIVSWLKKERYFFLDTSFLNFTKILLLSKFQCFVLKKLQIYIILLYTESIF